MKSETRAPVEPPEDFKRTLTRAWKSKKSVSVDGIAIYPPTSRSPYWRLKYTFNSKSTDLSGGKSLETAYATFLKLVSIKEARHNVAIGLPKNSNVLLSEALNEYIDGGGTENKWKSRTKKDRSRDFSKLIQKSAEQKLKCGRLSVEDIRDFINVAGTLNRGKSLIGHTRTFLLWGLKSGYFTQEQANFVNQIKWAPPKNSGYVQAKSRRMQSQLKYANEGGAGGEVLTPTQVTAFANALQKLYPHGEGLIQASANFGTRASETFLFTASKEVAKNTKGNYVDLDAGCIHVNYQVNDDPTLPYKTTKNGKPRRVVIPSAELVVNGFDILEWLERRSSEALEEQANGKNSLALLFPNSKGGILALGNFSRRKIRVATDSLGWRMDEYQTAHGNTRAMSRFTLHSLRAYFGTMAADQWGYTENQLLQQGSWADSQTVRRFYQGTTDETFNSVLDLHSKG